MSSDSSDSSEKVGNTRQPSPSKKWCFTLNNWSKKEYEELLLFFSSKSSFILGKETGDEGTPHLQGYVEFKTKCRLTGLKKLNTRAHWEKAKGTREQNYVYCSKDGDFEQNFYEHIYTIKPSDKFKPVIDLMNNYKFPEGNRKINVIVDRKGGSGKTEFVRWATQNYDRLIITGGKSADMKNQIVDGFNKTGRWPKYVIVDVPRASLGFISWTGIEEVKNMLFFSGKYEGGQIVGNKPFFLMMMNELPDLTVLSADRWNIIDFDYD